jgi:hypothetical protein
LDTGNRLLYKDARKVRVRAEPFPISPTEGRSTQWTNHRLEESQLMPGFDGFGRALHLKQRESLLL